MSLRLTVPPAVEPLELGDVKQHSVVEHAFSDAMLERLLLAARKLVESLTWRQLITATYEWKFDRLTTTLYVPRPRLQSVTSLKYRDQNGDLVTLVEGTDFDVDSNSEPGRIVPVMNGSWPPTRGHIHDVECVFDAGYGDTAADVPEQLKQAMLVIVDHWYQNRDGAGSFVPPAAKILMQEFRVRDPRIAKYASE